MSYIGSMRRQVNVELDDELVDSLSFIAERRGVTRSDIIRDALTEFVAREEGAVDADAAIVRAGAELQTALHALRENRDAGTAAAFAPDAAPAPLWS
jgi:predicted transcriptional regulator